MAKMTKAEIYLSIKKIVNITKMCQIAPLQMLYKNNVKYKGFRVMTVICNRIMSL